MGLTMEEMGKKDESCLRTMGENCLNGLELRWLAQPAQPQQQLPVTLFGSGSVCLRNS